jgi:hypothetical protein
VSEAVPPPPAHCPVCGAVFTVGESERCVGCGADLRHEALAQILRLDRRTRELEAERARLVAALAATRPAPPPPSGDPVTARPPDGRSETDRMPRTASRGIATLLAIAGVSLLVAAAAVFTAVAWTALGPLGQAALLLAATVLAGVAAVLLDARGLAAAAGAVGVLAAALLAVDVVGLERSGLVALDDFTVAAAAAAAALAALPLGRRGVPWVSTFGAIAAASAGIAATVALAGLDRVEPAAAATAGGGLALVVAATVTVWRTTPARIAAGVGAALLAVGSGLAGAVLLAAPTAPTAWGVAATLAPTVLLVLAARRTPPAAGAAALLAGAAVVAVVAHLDATDTQIALTVTIVATLTAWAVAVLRGPWRIAVAIGGAIAGLAAAAVTLGAGGVAAGRLAEVLTRFPSHAVDPWLAAAPLVTAMGLFALPITRRATPWIVAAAVATAVSGLDTPWMWVVALAAGLLLCLHPGRHGVDAGIVLAAAGAAWAAGSSATLALAAGITALVGLGAAGTARGPARIPVGFAAAAAGTSLGAAAHTAGAPVDVAVGIGVAVAFAGAVLGSLTDRDRPTFAAIGVGAAASLAAVVLATGQAAAGALLLVAAVGWLALAVVGRAGLRWIAAAISSLGVAVLLDDAGVELIEAWTAAPTVALAAAGLWWMVEDARVSSMRALWPALSVGLVPSLVTLADDPRVLGRALGLAAGAGLLALIGVRLRWRAPIVAGVVAGVWVALTQLAVVASALPRWITFAAIGAALVWAAATFERQQERGRALTGRLRDLR